MDPNKALKKKGKDKSKDVEKTKSSENEKEFVQMDGNFMTDEGWEDDQRFARAQSDPRFRRMPKRKSKVVIDSRFDKLLTDKRFGESESLVDKRGKRRKGVQNPMLHYYLNQDGNKNREDGLKEVDESEEDGRDALDVGISQLEADDPDDNEGMSKSADEGMSESHGEESSSSDDDEEDFDEQASVNSDIVNYLMASHEDTPTIDKETHRLAVVNLDWDHIKAADLYVVMTSCLPKGGHISSVNIYPSEHGLKCMEVEAVHGPTALLSDAESDGSGYDSDVNNNKLRSYELNKLRYYFAVVVCDSSATANHLYTNLDGTELLKTSNVFDLRFVPDSMEFKQPPRDTATEAPADYKVPDFETRSLQHHKVKLTWEDDAPERKRVLRRKFNEDQLDELNAYLASSDESDDDDNDGNDNRKQKNRLSREELLSRLQPVDGHEEEKSDHEDLEITFNTELEDLGKRILEKKSKPSETVWEAELRRRKEKKKARKKSSVPLDDDEGENESNGADDFFTDDSSDAGDKFRRPKKPKRKEDDNKSNGQKEQEATKEELELLFAEDDADHGVKGFNLKPKKVKGKMGKGELSEKLPTADVRNDPRFSALFTSPLYALDPTDPLYKRSAPFLRQQLMKRQSRGQKDRNVDTTQDKSVAPLPSDEAKEFSHAVEEKHELASMVRSIKRNLGALHNRNKAG